MELKEHSCESIGFTTDVSFDLRSWKRLAAFFTKRDRQFRDLQKSQLISSVLYEAAREVDYHYHFSARRFLRQKSQMVHLEVSLHPNIPRIEEKKKSKEILERAIPPIEQWISGLLPTSLERKKLQLAWRASFTYSTKRFQPIFQLPFKSPFTIPDKSSTLGEASISGLKLEFQRSDLRLTRVYFEAFPNFLAITTVFNQRVRIQEKLVEAFLIGAEETAMLFVKPKNIE